MPLRYQIVFLLSHMISVSSLFVDNIFLCWYVVSARQVFLLISLLVIWKLVGVSLSFVDNIFLCWHVVSAGQVLLLVRQGRGAAAV